MIWPLCPDQRPCETCFRGLEAGNAWRVTGEAARGSKYEVVLIVLSMYCASPPIAKILFIISKQEGWSPWYPMQWLFHLTDYVRLGP